MTDTHKVYDANGLALYFKVHLSDMEYEEQEDGSEEELTDSMKSKIVEKTVNGESKKFIKGERLKCYPTGMPLYSASRGMARPVVEQMTNKEAIWRVILLHNMTKKKILREKKGHCIKLKRMRWINILKSLRCFG